MNYNAMHLKRALCLLLACMMPLVSVAAQEAAPPMPDRDTLIKALCVRVVDGDTAWFEVGDATHKVRFIGLDTPETVHPSVQVQHYGPEASAFTTQTLLNQTVWLERDVEEKDIYERFLFYIWMDDGSLFNLTLVRNGYAKVLTYPPNVKYTDYFVAAQEAARNERIGVWSPLPFEGAESNDALFDFIEIKVSGVTHANDDGTNRQDILAKLSKDKLAKGEAVDVQLVLTEYKGKTAIKVFADNQQIGWVPKEEIQYFYDNWDRFVGATDFRIVGGGTSKSGKKLSYGVRMSAIFVVK